MITEYIKGRIVTLLGKYSKNGKASFVVSYIHNRRKFPNLRSPKDLSEILIKRVLDGEVNKVAFLADKYAVRKYVEERGLASILTKLIAVYDTPNQIDWANLPTKFALKANFGAGNNLICMDKEKLNIKEACAKVNSWYEMHHYSESERHYNLIPKKIICEEFIEDGNGGFPIDYKFMCIRGKVHCILGVYGREEGNDSYMPYSLDWKPMPSYYRRTSTASDMLPKPNNLNEMIEVAERLSEGVDFVRVDLYSSGSRIWFGEMTLTPAGCILHRWTQKALDEMGNIYNN